MYRVLIKNKDGTTLFDSVLATLREAYDFLTAHIAYDSEWVMSEII